MLVLISTSIVWLAAIVLVACLCRAAAVGDTALRPPRRFGEHDLL